MGNIIEIENLVFQYPRGNEPVLKGINLSITRGAFAGITGPTGAGKTTLCQCLNGLCPSYTGGSISGIVAVDGMDAPTFSPAELAGTVGSVFQDPDGQLICETVEEEIVFGMESLGFPNEVMVERLERVLWQVGLSQFRSRRTRSLSGGQKQRLAIAAALAAEPKVLVLDEPTSELDPQGTREVYEALRSLNKDRGVTVVIVDHKVEVMAEYVDSLIVMERGKIVADGPVREVLREDLGRYGVDRPSVSRLAAALFSRGFRQKSFPVTTEEGKAMIEEYRKMVVR